jgi:hypothetical protein
MIWWMWIIIIITIVVVITIYWYHNGNYDTTASYQEKLQLLDISKSIPSEQNAKYEYSNITENFDEDDSDESVHHPTIHAKCPFDALCGGDLVCDTKCLRCKKKIGGNCAVDNDCIFGLICHDWKCEPPINTKESEIHEEKIDSVNESTSDSMIQKSTIETHLISDASRIRKPGGKSVRWDDQNDKI